MPPVGPLPNQSPTTHPPRPPAAVANRFPVALNSPCALFCLTPPVIFLSPRSPLTFHDRHYWMKRQKRSLDMAICLVSPRAKLNRDLGQELVTRAMDRMKVLGMGRLCFQFFSQPQNVVIDSPCTRIVLVSPHFIEEFVP